MHISCTICTELYQADDATGVTKCGHLFHINCVKPWLQEHKTCPHCRAHNSIDNLMRVYFTEISGEDVHLNKNCEIDSLKLVLASEEALIHKIKMDLRHAENDLVDMNKLLERYENEIKNLKIWNESLLDNNEKLEYENKTLTGQCDSPTITRNHKSSKSCQIENNKNYMNSLDEDVLDLVELKTIIASYQEVNQQSITELLQKQLNIVISRNEELQQEIHDLKDEIRKFGLTVKKEDNQIMNLSQKLQLIPQMKNLKLKKRNESMAKDDVIRLQQYLKNWKVKKIELTPGSSNYVNNN